MPLFPTEKDQEIRGDCEIDTAQDPNGQGTDYLFAIAIDNYEKHDQFRDLNNPVRDASAVVECLLKKCNYTRPNSERSHPLESTSYIQYQSDEVYCLYNEYATWENVKNHLSKLLGRDSGLLTEADNLLIWFSGHGTTDTDTNSEKPSLLLYDQIIKVTELIDYLEPKLSQKNFPLKGKHILLILDCCKAGAIRLQNPGYNNAENFSRKVLTSVGAKENALDGTKGKHSPFTEAFLEVLKESFSRLNSNDLQSNISTKLEIKTREMQNSIYADLPVRRLGSGHFPFKLKIGNPPPSIIHEELFNLNFRNLHVIPSNSKRDRFTILTLKGETKEVHNFAHKVLFKNFIDRLMQSNTSGLYTIPITLGGGELGTLLFWEAIKKALNKESEQEVVQTLGDWLRDKNLMLIFNIERVDPAGFTNIQENCGKFAHRLHEKFIRQEKFNFLSKNYFFLLLQDTDSSKENFNEQLICVRDLASKCYIKVTEPLEGIDPAEFAFWWRTHLLKILKNYEIWQKDPLIIKKFHGMKWMPFNLFAQHLAEELNYTDEESNQLFSLLFEPHTMYKNYLPSY